MRATPDWGERVVAVSLCFEPLVGLLLRELLMRSPKFNGDALTQAVGHVAQLEWEWTRDWTAELVRFLLADEREGPHNSEVVERWIRDWEPRRAARRGLAPVFDELPAALPSATRWPTSGSTPTSCSPPPASPSGRRPEHERGRLRLRRHRDGQERRGDAVADALRKHPDVTVIEQPSFWEIKAKDRLVIDFDR